jgi:hypothetical protein
MVNGDITLYAQWVTIQYTVTYHANGGTGTVPTAQTAGWNTSISLANGDTLARNGYHFGGWNTNSSGTGTNYKADSSFTITANSTLYAQWVAPRIRTEDAYKEITNDGVVRIHLTTGTQYIFDGTETYRLYRSTTQSGGYILVATVFSDQLVLEDTTADWMTASGSYFYKVAAVSGGIEAMSTNGVRINRLAPRVFMQYSAFNLSTGYCGVRLENGGGGYMEWGGTTTSTNLIYELLLSPAPGSPPPPDNYTVFTRTNAALSWINRGPLAIRVSHICTITVLTGTVESSFIKSNWTFFTP